jgi:PadR family transcriptional regulator PadR
MALRQRHDHMDVLQGTLDMLILRTLQWGPEHGLRIAQAIRQSSEELLKIEAGSLYPALHRLEEQRWLTAEWRTSDKGQRAKYYRLTRSGRKQLVAEQGKWERFVTAINLVMRATEG